jgi:histidine ammonia-lyase
MFVAKRIRGFLLDCPSFIKEKDHIQDPYSFRCIPQVHGASNDSWTHVQEVFLNEADAVTDNPTVFSDEVISAGNFHGQKLALALDYGKMALAEWGSISERRINQLTLGKRGLQPFLASNPGLESGLMILQYSAAALVSRNKQRTVPSSTDSIDSSAGQEDHVSMGANAATDLIEVINGVWKIVSMELVCAIRSIESGEREPSKLIQDFINSYRSIYPNPNGDANLSEEINAAENFLRDTLIEDSEFLIFNE